MNANEYRGSYKGKMDDLVEKVANECNLEPDWDTALVICDYLNQYPDTCLSTSKMISKRFNYKNPRTSLFALELTDALMNNCECIHPIIGGKEFQAELIKLVQNKKTKEEVRDRALDLAQYWNDSFAFRTDVPLFCRTYQIFVRHGYNFPPNRPDDELLKFGKPTKPATHTQSQSVADRIGSTRPRANSAGRTTSSRDVTSNDTSSHNYTSTTSRNNYTSASRNTSSAPRTNNGGGREKSEKLDFASLRGTLTLTLELLSYCDPEHEDPSTNDILTDMLNSCKESQAAVRTTIETGAADAHMLNDLISLNEDLLKAQDMFDDLVKRRANFLKFGGRAQTASPTHQQYQQQQHQPHQQQHQQHQHQQQQSTGDLIDFSDFGPSYSQPSSTVAAHPTAAASYYPPGPYSQPAPYHPPPPSSVGPPHFHQQQNHPYQQQQQQQQNDVLYQQQQGNYNYGNTAPANPAHPAQQQHQQHQQQPGNYDYAQYLASFNAQANTQAGHPNNNNSGGNNSGAASVNYSHNPYGQPPAHQ